MKEFMNMYFKTVLNAQEINLAAMRALFLNASNNHKGQKYPHASEEYCQELISWISGITSVLMQNAQDITKIKSPEDAVKLQEKFVGDFIREGLAHGENFLKICNDYFQQLQSCAKSNVEDLTCKATDQFSKFAENVTNTFTKVTETAANTFGSGGCCGSTNTGSDSNAGHNKKQSQRSTEEGR